MGWQMVLVCARDWIKYSQTWLPKSNATCLFPFHPNSSIMSSLEGAFKDSYLKGDSTTPNITTELAAVHVKCLHAWNLLVSRAPNSFVGHLIETHLPKLPGNHRVGLWKGHIVTVLVASGVAECQICLANTKLNTFRTWLWKGVGVGQGSSFNYS